MRGQDNSKFDDTVLYEKVDFKVIRCWNTSILQ